MVWARRCVWTKNRRKKRYNTYDNIQDTLINKRKHPLPTWLLLHTFVCKEPIVGRVGLQKLNVSVQLICTLPLSALIVRNFQQFKGNILSTFWIGLDKEITKGNVPSSILPSSQWTYNKLLRHARTSKIFNYLNGKTTKRTKLHNCNYMGYKHYRHVIGNNASVFSNVQ